MSNQPSVDYLNGLSSSISTLLNRAIASVESDYESQGKRGDAYYEKAIEVLEECILDTEMSLTYAKDYLEKIL